MCQLEAAHRQLRATRQFVEEQAAEREHERDEFARRLHDARDDNQRLLARLQTNARILAEVSPHLATVSLFLMCKCTTKCCFMLSDLLVLLILFLSNVEMVFKCCFPHCKMISW